MKGGLSLLCAAAVALALLASTPAGAAAQAAKLLIFDTQLQSDVTVQWATTVSLGGKSLRATNDVKRATTDGYHEFDIPRTSGCGAISARTDLVWVQGYRSDGRCSRPTLDINSASTSTEGNVYCAETKYRSCSFWRCTCKTAFSIRAVLLDAQGRNMRVARPGSFRPCGVLTNEELFGGQEGQRQAVPPLSGRHRWGGAS
eukprot:TRINITY_DN2041_c0_g1_i2.p1 TRINITY_DN2041_c0_g1~~TRINITY_DN2041_c0_g1_i2.p1  ORF type:complete len:201 (-),score=66.58 TRINITY_DN2041_c0_g1_i2:156-758(-)